MSPEFIDNLREYAIERKRCLDSPTDALRNAEQYCARNMEEFHPEGADIVAKVYGGRFVFGTAPTFILDGEATPPGSDKAVGNPVPTQQKV